MIGFELLFLAGAVWVWHALARAQVNGLCRIALALLVSLRVSAAVAVASTGEARAMNWAWLTEGLFSFAFLYMLYHFGGLVSTCRQTGR